MGEKKHLADMRSTIEYLQKEGELLVAKEPTDPILEMAGIQVALEEGPAIFYEKVKGYPHMRAVGNIFARRDRIAKLFGVDDWKQFKWKCLEALRKPLPPKLVDKAPCQDVVMTGKDIDILSFLPVLKHTARDGARVMGSGNVLICDQWARGGKEFSYKRMHFRGKDWGSITSSPATHTEAIVFMDHRGKDIPMTINICNPPAAMMIAAAGGVHSVVPLGTDELAIAGAMQGFPVDIVKAKTVDAYAVANAEIVIEGYWTKETIWETEEAEKDGRQDVVPFFPEWTGYLGKTWKSRKFQITAITHRKDPIFYNQLAASYDGEFNAFDLREAMFYELADRLVPGMVIDTHCPFALRFWGGVIYQVKKRRPRDEGYQRNILINTLGACPGIRLVIAVDEDVDIYSMDDVMWAIMSRAEPAVDFLRGATGSRGVAAQPGEEATRLDIGGFGGGLGIDATVHFMEKWRYERAHYPSDMVDLKKWFSDKEIKASLAQQGDYARSMARFGWG
ncbi:MAG: UbiD family decarboxylase [Syntrophorhabdaceae bacterium]|nr:UbiD family decarboxylase [Syntrophorhabdaceae bacterium]MDD5242531.1 UbiD family decarboxylase [Syntrophorhabdaceae bacterium]